MAAKGIMHTGEIALTPEPGPTPQEIAILKAVVDEGAKAGVQINVHAVSTAALVAGIDAGVRRFVHLPNKGIGRATRPLRRSHPPDPSFSD